jgi:hypothetical protein
MLLLGHSIAVEKGMHELVAEQLVKRIFHRHNDVIAHLEREAKSGSGK